MKEIFAEMAKAKQKEAGGDRKNKKESVQSLMQNSAQAAKPPITTRDELAKIAGVSHDTIGKIMVIQKQDPYILVWKRKGREGNIKNPHAPTTPPRLSLDLSRGFCAVISAWPSSSEPEV
jgi:hypothetical protein